jgi:predicted ATPase/class 3 adenylate cyclase
VTFLFTDIEGSTKLWEGAPDAMRAALDRHDEMVQSAIGAHGGYVFSTGGDGFAAAFGRAADAVAAASAAQAMLSREPWPDTARLRVRMAVHSGEATERDGDYFGPAVNRAARLMAVGHGGQVLVSGTCESLLDGVKLRDLGEHRLRDLARPERVYQLVVDGLPLEFLPLRSLDARRTNLPLQVTSFVGRNEEMRQLRRLLSEHRLVTVTGVGGVGKTRLALEIAADAAADYDDGVWLCELAPATDADALAAVIATVLGVSPQPDRTVIAGIIEYLRARQLILLLDNCEHLLRPAAKLAASILVECGGVTVLATSREGLGTAGEHLWPLRSLDVDEAGSAPESECGGDAAQLFVDRARAVDPMFALDEAARRAVREICERLDGLPLAIELAAARTGALSVTEIAGLLDQRFRLLTGGRGQSLERHQTLRSTIDWSYSLLGPIERTVFARLGVFSGPFDAAAAQAVACDKELDRLAVIDVLAELVSKSMVEVVRGGSDRTQYQLLETLRQYAVDKLDPADVDGLRRRHAAHYAGVAEEVGAALQTPAELPARRQLALLLDNLRSAMRWALDRDEQEDQALGLRIIASLGELAATMRSAGFGAWAERAVPLARDADDGLRFAVLGSAAFSATTRGDFATATVLAQEAFVRGVPERCPGRTAAHTALAVTMYLTDLSEASAFLSSQVDELDAMGDTYAAVTIRSIAGMFAALGGDTARGHTETEQAVTAARALGNPTALLIALYGYALARWQDEPERSLAAVEESLRLAENGASDVVVADALELLARLQRSAGDTEGALRTITRSLRESISTGNRPSVVSSQWYLAEALGLLRRETEFCAVLDGYTTRSADAGLMPAVAGREGDLHARAIAAARTSLGDATFDRLTKVGAEMSYDDAAVYTMARLQQLIRSDGPE